MKNYVRKINRRKTVFFLLFLSLALIFCLSFSGCDLFVKDTEPTDDVLNESEPSDETSGETEEQQNNIIASEPSKVNYKGQVQFSYKASDLFDTLGVEESADFRVEIVPSYDMYANDRSILFNGQTYREWENLSSELGREKERVEKRLLSDLSNPEYQQEYRDICKDVDEIVQYISSIKGEFRSIAREKDLNNLNEIGINPILEEDTGYYIVKTTPSQIEILKNNLNYCTGSYDFYHLDENPRPWLIE